MPIELLRPSASGAYCGILNQAGVACPNHYQNMNDLNDATAVWVSAFAYQADIYHVDNSVGAGVISFIRVYARARSQQVPDRPSLKIRLRRVASEVERPEITITQSWVDYVEQWDLNPWTTNPWTWAEIDTLQIGLALRGAPSGWACSASEMWLEVYTPWTVKISGVTDPAEIAGVAAADIAAVKGVA